MVREQIVDEVVDAMVTPAYVAEDGTVAIALFDIQGQHVFSIQRETDEKTKQLVVELRAWFRSGILKALEREQAIAQTAGG